MLVAQPASAIPPFARQTGLACEACHTMPPELTAFGRRFQAQRIHADTRPPLVNDIDDHKKDTLWLTDLPESPSSRNLATIITTGRRRIPVSLIRPRAKRYTSISRSV